MAHVLVLPYPMQGHINPMLQFAKRLSSKGPKTTLVTTHFILGSTTADPASGVAFEPISDGYDEGGVSSSPSMEDYFKTLETVGSRSLRELIERYRSSGSPFTCIVFDTYVPWAKEVAREAGVLKVAFSTQSIAASATYHYVNKDLLGVPGDSEPSNAAFGLPSLLRTEFPSMALGDGPLPTLMRMSLTQFEGLTEEDWVIFNSFEELEEEVVTGLRSHWRVVPVGPTVPSMLVDKRLDDDKSYGFNLLKPEEKTCMKWLSDKEDNSVIYVSFGSFATLEVAEMEEIARGLALTKRPFLWVVRDSELSKLPTNFVEETKEKGLVVTWCPQLSVLGHQAVGCFVTHCGWNSTLEALSLGVPIVAMPQWTDQPTNAKFVEEVWGVGVRVKVGGRDKMVKREEMERCVKNVLEGERRKVIRGNAKKWKGLVKKALSEGGSSDKNLDGFVEFVNAIVEVNVRV